MRFAIIRFPGTWSDRDTYHVLHNVLEQQADILWHREADLSGYLDQIAGSDVPGLQYMVVDADQTLFEYAGGWADIQANRPMTPGTTLMAYSMTKTFTAVAVLQLVEQGRLGLADELDRHVPDTPYTGRGLTIRQLLAHTAGIPNPIPLRWVHLSEADAVFDEAAALAQVLQDNPKLASEPGERFAYTNSGYWLLGAVIEQVTGMAYAHYVRASVLAPLDLPNGEVDFTIPDPGRHANGYLARYSWINLLKPFLTAPEYWGGYEGNWLRLKGHSLNGPAFGGLVGSARGFGRFLQDQLRPESALLSPTTKQLLETQQTNRAGEPIPMSLGWHVGEIDGSVYFFKEGGGGGFHSEMRLYPARGLGTVVMVNITEFDSHAFLDRAGQGAACDADLLPDIDKEHRLTGVLADGIPGLARDPGVLQHLLQHPPAEGRLF